MLDRFNRDITYLRISVTDLCNLSCKYCSNSKEIKAKHSDLFSNEDIVKVVSIFKELGINKVRITGGEPLLKRGLDNLIEQLSLFIPDIGLTTNGQLLEDRIQDLFTAGLKSINVSLDTLDKDKYYDLTNGDLSKTLKGLELSYKLGLKIKLNGVLLKGVNDSNIEDILGYSKSINAKYRFIELMPFSTTLDYFNKYYISSDDMINKYKMEYKYSDGTCDYYTYKSYEVGFIRPITHKFCKFCNRIRMNTFGDIIPCLHSNEVYSIKEYINDDKLLKERLISIINLKPEEHHIEEGKIQSLDMRKIGG